MSQPSVSVVPLRPATPIGEPCTQDVLIRITTPAQSDTPDRRALNLGLVIDRSGSMSGSKLDYARRAARFAVEQLMTSDRVSITVFDDHASVVQPSTLAWHREPILRQIDRIRSGGGTALHGAWVQGAGQVREFLETSRLNRVILLSDGQANVGQTNPDVIASDVHRLAGEGVSTTAMGIGDDYNEDLLEAMARSGDGNFCHIESPEQLPAFFSAELQGLAATLGRQVTLHLSPGEDVVIADQLNDLDCASDGSLRLPNLVAGSPISLVVRLTVPRGFHGNFLLEATLSWQPFDHGSAGTRRTREASLSLPAVTPAIFAELRPDRAVETQVAVLMAARARQEAVRQMDRGTYDIAVETLSAAMTAMRSAPPAPETQREIASLQELQEDLKAGQYASSRKKMSYQSFSSQRSRNY